MCIRDSDNGLWDADKEKALQADSKNRVEKAVEEYLATEPQPPTAMVDYLFETLPPALQAQRERIAAKYRGGES